MVRNSSAANAPKIPSGKPSSTPNGIVQRIPALMPTANAPASGEIAELKDKLAQEKFYLGDQIYSEPNFREIIGISPALRQVLRNVETLAATDCIALITGETGTGKELVARGIYDRGSHKDRV